MAKRRKRGSNKGTLFSNNTPKYIIIGGVIIAVLLIITNFEPTGQFFDVQTQKAYDNPEYFALATFFTDPFGSDHDGDGISDQIECPNLFLDSNSDGSMDIVETVRAVNLLSGASHIYGLDKFYKPPLAEFTIAQDSRVIGTPIQFDASSSTVPDVGATIIAYSWDFGDGYTLSKSDKMANIHLASHIYTIPGTYEVTLTVEESRNNHVGSSTQTITISATEDSEPVITAPSRLGAAALDPAAEGLVVLNWITDTTLAGKFRNCPDTNENGIPDIIDSEETK